MHQHSPSALLHSDCKDHATIVTGSHLCAVMSCVPVTNDCVFFQEDHTAAGGWQNSERLRYIMHDPSNEVLVSMHVSVCRVLVSESLAA